MTDAPDQPIVTVVTVCLNAATTLEACVASVAGQTYPRIEYIVVDGGSTDGTAAILERHRASIDVLVTEPDRGIYDAMNKAIALASGEFLLFINADDFIAERESVEAAMAEIAGQPDGDVYFGSLLVRTKGGTQLKVWPPPEDAAEGMVLGSLPHQATFARRAVFARTGPFDLRWRRHADYDWWMKVIGDPAIKLRQIRTVVASYALGGASSELEKGQPEVYAIQNEAPLYNTPEWDRRRLVLFQNAYLAARIEVARLREVAARGAPAGSGRKPVATVRGRRLRRWLVAHLPDRAVVAVRAAKRRVGPRRRPRS